MVACRARARLARVLRVLARGAAAQQAALVAFVVVKQPTPLELLRFARAQLRRLALSLCGAALALRLLEPLAEQRLALAWPRSQLVQRQQMQEPKWRVAD